MQRHITDDFGNVIFPEVKLWQYIVMMLLLDADQERA